MVNPLPHFGQLDCQIKGASDFPGYDDNSGKRAGFYDQIVGKDRYTGKQFDPMVGLYNYGFRDYNPHRGEWTTQDPIRAGANWYAYVNQDPVNWVDPLGFTASDLKNAGNGPKVVLSNGMSLYVPPPEPQTPLFTVTRKQWDLAGQLSNPNYVLESSAAVLGDLSFGLNAAAIASSFVYPPAAAVFASASIVADSLSTALYTVSALNGGDKIAAALSVGSLALDAFIPTSVGFSLAAGSTGRFRSLATGKFVTKAAGRAATAKGPTLGALYNVGSNAAEGANK